MSQATTVGLGFAPARIEPWAAIRRVIRSTAALLLFFLAWEILPRIGVVDQVFLPPFSAVVVATWHMLLSGALTDNLVASLCRTLSGLALAIVVAVPAGLAIGSSKALAEILDPLLEIFRNTAPLALLPVFTLILGIGETSKVAMVFYAASWPILLSTANGIRTVDPLLVKAARSMGLGRLALFRKVILPASVPTIFTGVRLAAALSVLVLIAAEMVGAKAGLGYLVNAAQFNFQIPEMYSAILTLSLLGVSINTLLVRIERRLTGWNRA